MKPALLVLILILVGCAGKPTVPAVRLGIVGTGLQTPLVPVLLAHSLGFYKEEGLDVLLESLPSYDKATQAMVGGSVDVAVTSFSQVLYLAAEGQPVRSFFVSVKRNSFVLIVAPASTARVQRAEDLRGAEIGIIGTTGLPFLHHYMATHGLRPPDFRTITIGVGASSIAAIESGRIAAANVAGGDHIRLLRRHPSLRVLVDSSTPEGMVSTFGSEAYAAGLLTAKPAWLDSNPETARRLARATQRGLEWIAAHSDQEILEKLPDAFRSTEAAEDIAIIRWARGGFTNDGRMPAGAPEAWKRHLGVLVENVRNTNIDLAATWTNDFLPEEK